MKRFKIIRLSDKEAVFTQDRESIKDVIIPKGWGLHLEHTIKDENDNDVVVPATCEIAEEEIIETVIERRVKDYQREIDPRFQEAVLDHLSGKPEKMTRLLEDYEKIKLRYPIR